MAQNDIKLNLNLKQSYSINQLFDYILHFTEDKKMVGFWNLDKKKQQALLTFANYLLKEIEKGMTKEMWQQLEIIHLDGGFKRCIDDLNCIINTYKTIMKPDFKDETLHLVSDKGRIVRLSKTSRKKGTYKITRGSINNGYKYIECKKIQKGMNRVIYLSFHPRFKQEDFCMLVVDHLDENSLNDELSNLEAITQAENTRRRCKGRHATHGKKQSIPLIGTNLDTKETKCFTSSVEVTKQLGLHNGNISEIINGKRKRTQQKSTGHWWTFCIDKSKIVRLLPGEIWKDVVIYEPNEETKTYTKISAPDYKITNYGRYQSPKQFPDYATPDYKTGYCRIEIRLSGKKKHYGIHRLVLWAFEGPPPIFGQTPDHKDRNRSNNKLSNLKYATNKEQRENQTRSKCKKGQLPIKGEHWTVMRWPDTYKGH